MRKSRRLEESINRKNQIKAELMKKESNLSENGESDRDLNETTKDILIYLLNHRKKWISLDKILESFKKSELKVLTIIFVFDGLGMIKILDNRRVLFLGVQGSIQQFISFVLERVENWKIKTEKKIEKDKAAQKTEMLK